MMLTVVAMAALLLSSWRHSSWRCGMRCKQGPCWALACCLQLQVGLCSLARVNASTWASSSSGRARQQTATRLVLQKVLLRQRGMMQPVLQSTPEWLAGAGMWKKMMNGRRRRSSTGPSAGGWQARMLQGLIQPQQWRRRQRWQQQGKRRK